MGSGRAVAAAGAPGLPGPHGVRANLALARSLLREPAPALDDGAARWGRSFRVGLGPVQLAVVGAPDDLDVLFAEPNEAYRWGHAANALGFAVGPTSMIVSDGEDHRRRRAAVQPALARRRLDGWMPMIVAQADQAIDRRLLPALAGGGTVDVYPVGKDLILAITVLAFFGNGLEGRTAEIGAHFDEVQGYLELPALRQLPHPLPRTRRARVRAAVHALDRLIDEEVARRAVAPDRRDRGGEGTDLLDSFVGGGSGLSPAEVRDQVKTLIGAGYNTTAATVAWAVDRAAGTPGVWARLRTEADAALGPAGAGPDGRLPLGSDTLAALPYTRAVVHEALRLHPAGLFAPRQARRQVALASGRIPARAMVLWSPYLAGRDPAVWEHPLDFRPERHLDPTPAQAAAVERAWVPFGRGPRRCIGFALAQMELTLVLARLAQRLDLELVDPAVPRPHGMVVNRPAGGVVVRGGAAR